ncbi:caspase Dronc-like isoform X3 [Sitodiplosis mosellana]|uniref:caspase Dronc-like isoform X3 n=1 Tax=Sitodiplosis mosellana TaxID=263140 RepID=UPI002443E558|nr:caspase Dronc-like isoform X3 [Sitodiplosis mosellana]
MEMTPFLNEIKSPFRNPIGKSKKLNGDYNGKIKIYSMNSQNRGIFCFVNINNFQRKKEKKREGGNIDRDKLVTLFREMGFVCYYYEDMSKDEFIEMLKKLSVRSDLPKYDCLVLSVSSHGNGDRNGNTTIEFSDGAMVYVNEIITYFSNVSCPHLLGKPKIFIFPSCRGPRTDRALEPMECDNCDSKPQEIDTITDPQQTFSHMKICFSTVAGYSSFRDAETGSCWIG